MVGCGPSTAELEAVDYLLQAKQQQGKSLLRSLLNRELPKALVIELQSLLWSELAESPLADCSDKKLIAIGEVLAQWSLKPSATEGYRTAEVTLGGVDTDGISSKTMAAKQYLHAYQGHCRQGHSGYGLQA